MRMGPSFILMYGGEINLYKCKLLFSTQGLGGVISSLRTSNPTQYLISLARKRSMQMWVFFFCNEKSHLNQIIFLKLNQLY